MGTPGVPLNLPKDAIVAALKKNDGKVNHASKDLDIHPWTLRKLIKKDPELQDLLQKLRHNYDEKLLDQAEETLKYALEQKHDDVNAALKSSFYVLNNKGRARGYNPPTKLDAFNEKDKESVENLLSTLREYQESSQENKESSK